MKEQDTKKGNSRVLHTASLVNRDRKLNICIVHPNRNAYSETFVRQHIDHLPGNVLALYGSWLPAFDKNDHCLADSYLTRSFLARVVKWGAKLLPAVVANRLPADVKGYPHNDELDRAAFRHFLRKEKIDVVLAEFMLKGVAVMDVCQELNIPLAVHTHGGGDICNQQALQSSIHLFQRLFEVATAIVSVDSFSSKKLIEFGLSTSKLFEIRYGVNLTHFKTTTPSSNFPTFVGVGRFTDKKAPYLTLLAFKEVVAEFPDAKLVLAGHGELSEVCRQMVQSFNLEKSVFFPGVITPAEVAMYLASARAFVQHSITTSQGDSEGTPVAILEAMASGLPVISTNHNGIADIIEDGVNGLLVEEGDISAMAFKMKLVLKNQVFADQLGKAARQAMENKFEMSKVTSHLYEMLLWCSMQNGR